MHQVRLGPLAWHTRFTSTDRICTLKSSPFFSDILKGSWQQMQNWHIRKFSWVEKMEKGRGKRPWILQASLFNQIHQCEKKKMAAVAVAHFQSTLFLWGANKFFFSFSLSLAAWESESRRTQRWMVPVSLDTSWGKNPSLFFFVLSNTNFSRPTTVLYVVLSPNHVYLCVTVAKSIFLFLLLSFGTDHWLFLMR